MTTKVIDTSVTGDHFLPATGWIGKFTSDGNACSIPLGFKPAYVKVFNETDTIIWEKLGGSIAANSIKTTGAADPVQDTATQIALVDGNAGNWSLLLGATLCGTAKSILVYVVG